MYLMSFLPEGRSEGAVREDYTKIPAGGSHTIRITSNGVRRIGLSEVPPLKLKLPSWEERKPGRLRLFLSYTSWNEQVLFAKQLEGRINSYTKAVFVK
jgi:hypothetical protein